MGNIAVATWMLIGFALLVVVLTMWFIGMYNHLQRMRIYIQEAWATIDVQLKRKANILTNLVDTLRMQMNFEQNVLVQLTQARSGIVSGDSAERMKANDALTRIMPSLYAVSENYPQLGTNPSFTHMMEDIKDCEDKITYSRQRYNATVARFNIALVTIPSNFVAAMFNFQAAPLFEISQEQRDDADNLRIGNLS